VNGYGYRRVNVPSIGSDQPGPIRFTLLTILKLRRVVYFMLFNLIKYKPARFQMNADGRSARLTLFSANSRFNITKPYLHKQ